MMTVARDLGCVSSKDVESASEEGRTPRDVGLPESLNMRGSSVQSGRCYRFDEVCERDATVTVFIHRANDDFTKLDANSIVIPIMFIEYRRTATRPIPTRLWEIHQSVDLVLN